MADEFRGMKKEEARKLAAALDVAGGALSIQGPLISGLLAKWDGDQGDLGKFPAESTWSQDQAKDIRRRIGILDSDPKAELMLIGLTGVLDTWQKVKDRKGEIGGYVEEFQELKKNVTAPLRLTKIASGIEASLQLYQRWKQGGNVKAAKAVLDLNKYFGVTGDRLKAKNIAYIQEILKLKRIEMLYEQPWKWQQVARTFITTKLRIPLPAKLLNQAPGLSILDRISLPLAAVHGLKQIVLPDHKGVLGGFDRGMGAVELGGAAAVMGGASAATFLGASAGVAAAVPVVGWVALGVAGAYFLGTWAYDNREAIARYTKKAWKATTKWAGDTVDKGKEIVNGAKSAVTNLVPDTVKKYGFW
ncbi:hypothetical protein DCW30_30035 [Streptomyces alfalfae]|uniref:WXG100 family type VII secretion target n=1 Tax=Streptomyces alfalfae TaxID=1642299 RepID=A0ABM6GU61_9ACTN|nr:hypothetical protein [Streptomyces alfalfae]APY86969.1 hypothetical protein A7J05_15595 [Streptomyces alfalfae]AYA17359.1 hypothetical protein D3X13_14880 [Streptomyces fradiae]RXX37133.1 hypothetical protein DCW30_30035 [Streptomyces alfalfae]RZM87387.1 hypothetical protein D4104_27720 [Streptomyces alfalfae]